MEFEDLHPTCSRAVKHSRFTIDVTGNQSCTPTTLFVITLCIYTACLHGSICAYVSNIYFYIMKIRDMDARKQKGKYIGYFILSIIIDLSDFQIPRCLFRKERNDRKK